MPDIDDEQFEDEFDGEHYDEDEDEDEDEDDFGHVAQGQECDHCGKPATSAINSHYFCDLHKG
ncbi:TPA: hypothetical protein ACSTNG_001693 [Serratia fonticola]